nr:MAG TPA: hypothetical protein [Caudoviricetes sp.]
MLPDHTISLSVPSRIKAEDFTQKQFCTYA